MVFIKSVTCDVTCVRLGRPLAQKPRPRNRGRKKRRTGEARREGGLGERDVFDHACQLLPTREGERE